jgi:DNA-binding NtrC family response regulator
MYLIQQLNTIMAKDKKPLVYKEVNKTVYFNSINEELKRIGLTQEKTAELLGITRSGLIHRIIQDKPSVHWEVYGLSQYFSYEYDNFGERDL